MSTKLSKATLIGLSAVLLGLITLADYKTGYDLGFFVFYYIPVGLAAWVLGLQVGLFFAAASALSWYCVDLVTAPPYSLHTFGYWNGGIRFVAFAIIVFTICKIHDLLARQRTLNDELSVALANVKELKGLIPVCSCCRRMRDDSGYWSELGEYLRRHTDAEVSFGFCPDCAAKVMPRRDEILAAGCGGSSPLAA